MDPVCPTKQNKQVSALHSSTSEIHLKSTFQWLSSEVFILFFICHYPVDFTDLSKCNNNYWLGRKQMASVSVSTSKSWFIRIVWWKHELLSSFKKKTNPKSKDLLGCFRFFCSQLLKAVFKLQRAWNSEAVDSYLVERLSIIYHHPSNASEFFPMQIITQIRPNLCLLYSETIQIGWNYLYLQALPKE